MVLRTRSFFQRALDMYGLVKTPKKAKEESAEIFFFLSKANCHQEFLQVSLVAINVFFIVSMRCATAKDTAANSPQ